MHALGPVSRVGRPARDGHC